MAETHPLLCRGLVVLPVGDGLLFEGGPKRRLLTGAAATSVLPEVLSLLDGHHTLAQIATEAGLTPGQTMQAVTLLDRCGLLDVGPPAPGGVASFLSRNVSATRAHNGSGEVLAALTDSSVLVVAAPLVAAAIKDDLRGAGVGRVGVAGDPDAIAEPPMRAIAASPRRLVVVLDAPAHQGSLLGLERRCRDHRVPVLRFASRPDHVEVGPLFGAGHTACYRCFSAGYESVGWNDGIRATQEPDRQRPEQSGSGDWLAAGLVTAEALAVLAQVTAPTCFRTLTRISVPSLSGERFAVTPLPGCPDCAWPTPPNELAELARTYEWLMEAPPAELRSPSQDTAAEQDQPAFSTFPTSPRHRLPETPVASPSGQPRGVGSGASDLDEPAIADILRCATGQAGGGDASASVEVYLLTPPGWFGDVPGTMFNYDPTSHELIPLRSDAVPLEHCLAGSDLAVRGLAAALVFVGTMASAPSERPERWYRLTHLDTGRATVQLAAVAGEHGLAVRFASAWEARLTDLLELTPEYETITTIAGLYRSEDVRGPDP
jgi:bacteriocin biosynthesis cyclodehydratase domain-containing protein